MELAIAPVNMPPIGPITLEELRRAPTDACLYGLVVKDLDGGAAIHGEQGARKGQNIVYVHAVLCHDRRVKLTFSKTDNAFDDAVLLMREFDQDRAFAAALRIVVGDGSPRFRNKDRVLAFVKKVGVSEIAKNMPPVFSNFMFAVLHAFNCKTGKDLEVARNRLRGIMKEVLPQLSEEDVVRIYREEMVDFVDRL